MPLGRKMGTPYLEERGGYMDDERAADEGGVAEDGPRVGQGRVREATHLDLPLEVWNFCTKVPKPLR